MKSVRVTGNNQSKVHTLPHKIRSLPSIHTLEARVLMSAASMATTMDTPAAHFSSAHLSLARPAAATRLAAPSGLTATQVGSNSVALQWADINSTATGYYVLRSTDGLHFKRIAKLTSPMATAWTDTGAQVGRGYTYEVQAFRGGKVSPPSNRAVPGMPIAPPSDLAATIDGSSVDLNWTDNDPSATSYELMRSADGLAFSELAIIHSGTASRYTDSTVAAGHAYSYEIRAATVRGASLFPDTVLATTPLKAPTGLTAIVAGNTVELAWTPKNDGSASGYVVSRSVDGSSFSQLVTLAGAGTSSFTDETASSGHIYSYQVQARNATGLSAPSSMAGVTTGLAAPTNLKATFDGALIDLAWTNNDPAAIGYIILRSTDGVNYTQIGQVTPGSAGTFIDNSVAPGTTYYYAVLASNSASTSIPSNVAIAAVPSTVAITTRYGNELVITADGTADFIQIDQNGSTLIITADGQTFTEPVPSAGVFVYARGGGDDTIMIDQSVMVRTTLDSIDGAYDTVSSQGANVSAWIDSSDSFNGSGKVHAVGAFAGGISKAIGVSLPDPGDSGLTMPVNRSLWGTGPVADDVNQGEVGDCYFVASLAAFAGVKPSMLQESAVDLGDGTFAVRFFQGGAPVYLRVTSDFAVGGFSGYKFAHPGSNNTIWAAVMEKAFCYFRTGEKTYKSIGDGWMGDVYTDLGVNSTAFFSSNYDEGSLFNMLSNGLAGGNTITLGTVSPPDLVADHAYTLISVSRDASGATHYVVRNPWGKSGDSLEDNQGYVTLNFTQFVNNFYDGCLQIS